jgi:hypothetical protein
MCVYTQYTHTVPAVHMRTHTHTHICAHGPPATKHLHTANKHSLSKPIYANDNFLNAVSIGVSVLYVSTKTDTDLDKRNWTNLGPRSVTLAQYSTS